jgi:hypothetical protein
VGFIVLKMNEIFPQPSFPLISEFSLRFITLCGRAKGKKRKQKPSIYFHFALSLTLSRLPSDKEFHCKAGFRAEAGKLFNIAKRITSIMMRWDVFGV